MHFGCHKHDIMEFRMYVDWIEIKVGAIDNYGRGGLNEPLKCFVVYAKVLCC